MSDCSAGGGSVRGLVAAAILILGGCVGVADEHAQVARSSDALTAGSGCYNPGRGSALRLANDASREVPLPFAVDFYGNSYTSLWVNSNGNVTLEAANPSAASTTVPDGSKVLIAPLYGDFNPEATRSADVFFNTIGTAPDRQILVTWYIVPENLEFPQNTFQLQLHESDGAIIFTYDVINTDGLNPDLSPMNIGLSSGAGQSTLVASGSDIPAFEGTATRFDWNGSDYDAFDGCDAPPPPPDGPSCEPVVDYAEGGCSGTFKAFSTADLAAYVASDYGRDGGANYQDLKIMADLADSVLEVRSPCTITLLDDVMLAADAIVLDGRAGVQDDNGYTLQADVACVVSGAGNAGLGAGSVVNAGSLLVQGEKTAKIGMNSDVSVSGAVEVVSTGDFGSSDAIIKSGGSVVAGSVHVEASRGAHIGQNVDVQAGAVVVTSNGDATGSDAGMKSGSSVVAESLAISASRTAKIGESTLVQLTGDLGLVSTGAYSGSLAIIKSGATVEVGGDAVVDSGNKSTLGQNTTTTVVGSFTMDAQAASKCSIAASASYSAASTAGVCL